MNSHGTTLSIGGTGGAAHEDVTTVRAPQGAEDVTSSLPGYAIQGGDDTSTDINALPSACGPAEGEPATTFISVDYYHPSGDQYRATTYTFAMPPF